MPKIRLYNTASTFAIVDEQDVELVNQQRWYLSPKGYAFAGVYNRDHKRQQTWLMHRLIMGCQIGDGKRINHCDKNRLNNRRENLRFATMSEDIRNRGKINHQENTK